MFVATFAPEAGEPLAAINARYPDVPPGAAQRTFIHFFSALAEFERTLLGLIREWTMAKRPTPAR